MLLLKMPHQQRQRHHEQAPGRGAGLQHSTALCSLEQHHGRGLCAVWHAPDPERPVTASSLDSGTAMAVPMPSNIFSTRSKSASDACSPYADPRCKNTRAPSARFVPVCNIEGPNRRHQTQPHEGRVVCMVYVYTRDACLYVPWSNGGGVREDEPTSSCLRANAVHSLKPHTQTGGTLRGRLKNGRCFTNFGNASSDLTD